MVGKSDIVYKDVEWRKERLKFFSVLIAKNRNAFLRWHLVKFLIRAWKNDIEEKYRFLLYPLKVQRFLADFFSSWNEQKMQENISKNIKNAGYMNVDGLFCKKHRKQ